nr:hypothetical protein [Tanacetum cinerariifolium]
MASSLNKRRAARKKKNKKKNMKASFSNHTAEKVFAEAEAVSEMGTSENEENEGGDVGERSYHDPATIANPGEKFSHDPTTMANPVLSDCVANGDQLSLESDLEAQSLRLPVSPQHEQFNASSTILPAGA